MSAKKTILVIIRMLKFLMVSFWVQHFLFRTYSPKNDDNRIVAGYIRQSYTRNPDDVDSPERQKANILQMAEKCGLGPVVFFEDVGGHRSGASIDKRPFWQKLEVFLRAYKVKVLIANDLARLHRKHWRIGQLIEWLDKYHVRLILAAPGRELDLSTAAGRMFIQFISIVDEYYVIDASIRQKDSIANRLRQGKAVGIPFGTISDKGYLKPRPDGVWLLNDGQYIVGKQDDTAPEPGAIWRGYYDCAKQILTLYTSLPKKGADAISRKMGNQGWMFCDKHHNPRPLTRDDVRRVIAGWPKYAGLTIIGRSKDRKVGEIPLDWEDTGRSVFTLLLLKEVALAEYTRHKEQPATGGVGKAYPYPFKTLLYCAHCEQKAVESGNPRLRTRLTGTTQKGKKRYKHAEGVTCACKVRSVHIDTIESQVLAKLRSVQFSPESIAFMSDMAKQTDEIVITQYEDLEAQRRVALARYRQKLANLNEFKKNGEISLAGYNKKKAEFEEKIAYFQNQVINSSDIRLKLVNCIAILTNISQLWQVASPEQKQLIAQLFFQRIVYDLDKKEIVDAPFKPWVSYLLRKQDNS